MSCVLPVIVALKIIEMSGVDDERAILQISPGSTCQYARLQSDKYVEYR